MSNRFPTDDQLTDRIQEILDTMWERRNLLQEKQDLLQVRLRIYPDGPWKLLIGNQPDDSEPGKTFVQGEDHVGPGIPAYLAARELITQCREMLLETN